MGQLANTPENEPLTCKITPDEAAAMFRAVFNLFRLWKLADPQARVLLGQPSPSTFYRWKRGEIRAVPPDTIWRLADLMGIHKALRHLLLTENAVTLGYRGQMQLSAVSPHLIACWRGRRAIFRRSAVTSTRSVAAGEAKSTGLRGRLAGQLSDYSYHLPTCLAVRRYR